MIFENTDYFRNLENYSYRINLVSKLIRELSGSKLSKEGGIYWKCFSKCFQSEKFCITFPRKNCCGIQVVKNEGRCWGIRKVPSWLAGEINAVQKMCFVLITQHNRVEKEKRMISCCSSNFETKAILCYLLFFFCV